MSTKPSTPPARKVHHVPGGYVIDGPDDDRGLSFSLGCVFARDLIQAVARAELMLDALRGRLDDTLAPTDATTQAEDPIDAP